MIETIKKGSELQDKHDIARTCYTRIMNEGHFAGLKLHTRVKEMLDPNNIMNPGRWGTPR